MGRRRSRRHHYGERVTVDVGGGPRPVLHFARRGASLPLGAHAQDVLADLGLPSRISRGAARGAARMSIHRNARGDASGGGGGGGAAERDGGGAAAVAECRDGGPDYVYHYSALGLEVLVDGLSHATKMVVLHTNFPG
jgi:hypothetical protein